MSDVDMESNFRKHVHHKHVGMSCQRRTEDSQDDERSRSQNTSQSSRHNTRQRSGESGFPMQRDNESETTKQSGNVMGPQGRSICVASHTSERSTMASMSYSHGHGSSRDSRLTVRESKSINDGKRYRRGSSGIRQEREPTRNKRGRHGIMNRDDDYSRGDVEGQGSYVHSEEHHHPNVTARRNRTKNVVSVNEENRWDDKYPQQDVDGYEDKQRRLLRMQQLGKTKEKSEGETSMGQEGSKRKDQPTEVIKARTGLDDHSEVSDNSLVSLDQMRREKRKKNLCTLTWRMNQAEKERFESEEENSIARYIRRNFFADCKFILNDMELYARGHNTISRHVMENMQVENRDRNAWWRRYAPIVKNTLDQKRSNVSTEIGRRFMSKYTMTSCKSDGDWKLKTFELLKNK